MSGSGLSGVKLANNRIRITTYTLIDTIVNGFTFINTTYTTNIAKFFKLTS